MKLSDIKDKKLRDRITGSCNEGHTNYEKIGHETGIEFGITGKTWCSIKMTNTTDHQKLNKTEKAFYDYLCALNLPWMSVQAMTLKLGDDCRYTPDFSAVNTDGSITFYEVKGFWRDDAKVKIKVAARMFRWAKFVVVQKSKNSWTFQDINP